jgi:hypothetical protein
LVNPKSLGRPPSYRILINTHHPIFLYKDTCKLCVAFQGQEEWKVQMTNILVKNISILHLQKP